MKSLLLFVFLLISATLAQAQNQKFVQIQINYSLGHYEAKSKTDGPSVGTMTKADFEKRFNHETGMAAVIDFMYANGYELASTLPAKEPAPAAYQLLFIKKK